MLLLVLLLWCGAFAKVVNSEIRNPNTEMHLFQGAVMKVTIRCSQGVLVTTNTDKYKSIIYDGSLHYKSKHLPLERVGAKCEISKL